MAIGGGLDGAVDCEADVAGPRGEGGARHDAECSVDGDGHHGEAEFYGEGVGSALEAADGAVKVRDPSGKTTTDMPLSSCRSASAMVARMAEGEELST